MKSEFGQVPGRAFLKSMSYIPTLRPPAAHAQQDGERLTWRLQRGAQFSRLGPWDMLHPGAPL